MHHLDEIKHAFVGFFVVTLVLVGVGGTLYKIVPLAASGSLVLIASLAWFSLSRLLPGPVLSPKGGPVFSTRRSAP